MTTNCVTFTNTINLHTQSEDKTSDWRLFWKDWLIFISIDGVNDKQLHFSMTRFCTRQKTLSFWLKTLFVCFFVCFYKEIVPVIVIFVHPRTEESWYKSVWGMTWNLGLSVCVETRASCYVYRVMIWGCIKKRWKFYYVENHHNLMSVYKVHFL